ncbi:OLC1v1003001C1 [Oldenlandia corymbosa var. corymbosa]|uniref:OLC1v1003001C1 n=1 Tax=Oldenlandia corymbosa var. corymbosa TaxID=529605 RepID=A0AAV1D9Q0_OLDCO|nr:OLC1v1003001C1 [Oldenlandia corymbosa var. corymbosa]
MDGHGENMSTCEMGREEALMMEEQGNAVEQEEDNQQKQPHEEEEVANVQDSEDEMNMDQYLASRAESIHPSLSSKQPNQMVGPRRSRRIPRKPQELIGESGNNLEAPSSVMDRAQSSLDPQYPSFAKKMVHSNVVYGFFLKVPDSFCKTYMPNHNVKYLLENEDGEIYKTKFLAARGGLSEGWRAFARKHRLIEGDAVVFHLIGDMKFKVFIVRSTSLGVDGTPELLQLEKNINDEDCEAEQPEDPKHAERYRQATIEYNLKNEEMKTLKTQLLKVEQKRLKLHSEMETLKEHIQRDASRFLEEATAPW